MEAKENSLTCPNCGMEIKDTKAVRCPRCFATLYQLGCNGNCSKCIIKEKCR